MWQNCLALFSSSSTSGEVVLAQLDAYKRRVPILYVVIFINVVALSFTHFGAATPILTVCVPAFIGAVIILRLMHWLRVKSQIVSVAEARRMIRKTTYLGSIIALATISWALALYSHANADNGTDLGTRAHVVLFVGVTVISCVCLMMHVKAMAVMIMLIVVPTFSAYLIYRGSAPEIAIALNLLLVCAAMMYVLLVYASDFEKLVLAKVDLGQLNEVNARLANTDPATGLPNRRHFFAALQARVEEGKPFAVAVVDLDGFKQVNDLHGHLVGDDVLAEIGRRLVAHAPAGASVARMGGDEFALLLSEHDVEEVMALAENTIDACRAPIAFNHVIAHVGASIGISIETADGHPEAQAVDHYERADYALFHAKKCGRGRAEIFSPDHASATRNASVVEQALRRADLEEEITVVYQPIVRATDGSIVAFEALARWMSPKIGTIPPNIFIPIAESNELIYKLTRVIIRKALIDASGWPDHIRVKINLSVRDLTSAEQMIKLITILRQAPLDPKRITFEITETVLAEDVEVVSASITSLRALGAAVAIDDFGVGYSNLNYVQRLSPDVIKIDKSFVDRIATDPGTLGIVKTILELCRNMGAASIAEGIESKIQADILRSAGCNEFQGYYFSRPLTHAAASELAHSKTGLQGDIAATG